MSTVTTTPTREEIARQCLRAQKAEHEKAMREAGLEAGREFVLETEEGDSVYLQMSALVGHCLDHDFPEDLAGLIGAMDASDTCLWNWFSEQYGRDTKHPAWVSGFVFGALATFRELAP